MKYFPYIICLETKESLEMQGMLGNFKQSIKIAYLKSQKEVAHIFFGTFVHDTTYVMVSFVSIPN